MMSRIVASTLGFVAGVAALIMLQSDRLFAELSQAAAAHLGRPDTAAALAAPWTRLAWTLSVSIALFAVVTLLALLVAGAIETLSVRARLAALRHDPVIAGRWNPADWRSAFAGTAIADRAEIVIAAIVPGSGADRRIITDTALLAGLDRIWLKRLTMTPAIVPLPPLLLGVGATLALLGGDFWQITLAAGTASWLVVRAIYFLVSSALGVFVSLSLAAATAAIRPLTSTSVVEALPARAAGEAEPEAVSQRDLPNSEALAAAFAAALAEPLARLAQATERLSADPVQQRSQTIDAALAEIRAGIERLLAAAPDAG